MPTLAELAEELRRIPGDAPLKELAIHSAQHRQDGAHPRRHPPRRTGQDHMGTSDSNDKIRVSITWSERVTYAATVVLSRDDYEKYESLFWNGRDGAEEVVDRYIGLPRDNWQDSRDIEPEDFEIITDEEQSLESGTGDAGEDNAETDA